MQTSHNEKNRKIIQGKLTMKQYYSDRKGYSFLLLITTLATAALIGLLSYLLDKLEIMFPDLFLQERSLPEMIINGIIIAFVAAYIVFALIFLRLWHRSLSYELNEKDILSQAGVLTKTTTVMKRSSIQYVTRISLPLPSLSSFNFIIISALGGRTVMMFLSDSDCTEVMDTLSRDGVYCRKEREDK